MSMEDKLGALDAAIAALKATVNEQYGGRSSDYAFNSYTPELVARVEYDVQPYEPPTQTYPGCDLEVTPTSVMCYEVEMIGLYRSDPDLWSQLCDECMEDYFARMDR